MTTFWGRAMGSFEGVFVVAEQEEGTLAEISLELTSKARALASRLGTGCASILLGHRVEPLAEELIAYGCDEVYLADDPRLTFYTTLPYARVVADIIRERSPYIVIFGATTTGRDLAPRVASELRAGLTADCTDLQIGDYTDKSSWAPGDYKNLLLQIRPAFGGNLIATIVNPRMHPQMATVREGVMKMGKREPGRRGEVIPVAVRLSPFELITQVVERVKAPREVNLKKARVIVSGGAGVGSRENFQLIHELARALGGEVGASRAAVDAGLIGRAHQVGQTGTTVRPKLYIACGISGSVQHRAGMAESSKVVAINTDPEAPIFSIAHYKVVGDLKEVISTMIKAFKTMDTKER